jgi:diphthine synthase
LLSEVENTKKEDVITPDTAAVGIARAGSKKPTLKADFIKSLGAFDFGGPPYSLIFLGDMHFMEVEALIAFAGAPSDFRRLVK